MKKLFGLALAFSLAPFAHAEEQNYKLSDSGVSSKERGFSTEMCVKEYRIDSAADLAKEVLKKEGGADAEITEIQDFKYTSEGPEYDGEVRERVYLVKSENLYYQPGVYMRIQISEYGEGTARKSFSVHQELLNHRYSAEIAEYAACADLSYRLADAKVKPTKAELSPKVNPAKITK